MRKILLLVFIFVTSLTAFSQNFSNKGKDFWVGYGYHQDMGPTGTGPNGQNLNLYFATDVVTTVTVSIPGLGYSQTYPAIPANTVFAIPTPMPKAGAFDSRLYAASVAPENKGIHIVADNPIVAYAHIYNSSVSGATVLFPTNTLGKEYYSVNYTNNSNSPDANAWFYVIATEPGSTDVEITPKQSAIGHPAGIPFTVTLQQGQIYFVKGDYNNGSSTGSDLTGSLVKSIAAGNTCKKIAVYSGSGRIYINCGPGQQTSSDNYMVQCLPKAAWGKTFLTTPSAGYNRTPANPAFANAFNIYRICVSDPTAVVTVDGAVLPVGTLQGNFYYELPSSNQPRYITSDKPVMVAQYFPTRAACSNPTPAGDGDPEVIYLSPVEQSIQTVKWLACSRFGINSQKHYINVVIPNTGTAISSFKLDGAAFSSFTVHPQNPAYSYAIINVSSTGNPGTGHVIQSDSGFNAIAYGYGSAESYGYNAGTNVKDLNTKLEVNNPNSSPAETEPSACTNSPFQFKVYFPDSAASLVPIRYDSIEWNVLTNPGNFVPNNFPVMIRPTSPNLYIEPDSVNTRNGKYVAWYSLPGLYYVTAPGVYQVRITLYRSSSEGCGNSIEYEFNLTVSDPPTASFTAPAPGCYLEPVVVTETTPQIPKATYKQWWEFYDPATLPTPTTTIYSNMSSGAPIRTVSHTFTTPGIKQIRHVSITTPGCISDTIVQNVTLPDKPFATIAGTTTACINSVPSVPVTFTGTDGTAEYTFNYTIDNGTGPGPVQTTPPSTGGTYIFPAPSNTAGTFVYNLVGVTNALPVGTPCTRAITGQSTTVTVLPDHSINLNAGSPNPSLCINTVMPSFTLQLGGGATGIAAPVNLPPGVTATQAGNIVTIAGTPTVAGSYPYSITTTGNACITSTFNGTITVDPDHTIALNGGNANPTLCINTPMPSFSFLLGGGATGIAAPVNLPPGVTATLAGNIVTVAGTPTASGTFNYSITTSGNTCLTSNVTGTIVVDPDHTIAFNAGNPNPTLCVNTLMPSFTLTIGGGATNIIAPVNLPAGVTATVVGTTVTIAGTPTVAGTFNYSITTSGNTCLTATYTGTITVNDDATIALTSAPGTNNQTICINTAVADIDYQVAGGGTGATIAWTPGAPAGISFIPLGGNNFRITGIATAAGTYNYTISTTGPCIKPQATGTLVVNPDHTIGFNGGVANPTVCVNTLVPAFTLVIGGGANNIATPAGLPPGVTATVTGNIVTITGIPTLAGTYPYSITTSGNACLTATYTNTITVTADATISLTSGSTSQTVCRNTAIGDIDYATGGSATGATIAWAPSAPTGITFTPLGGGNFRIAGTPTVVGTQTYTYTISTTGPCVKPTATGSITVNSLPIAAFSVPPPSCANNTVAFTNSSTPNAAGTTTWAWDFGDPNATVSNPNTSSVQSPTHYYILPGTYTATLNVTNSNTCISNPDASVTFVVNDTPRAGFIVPDVCINDVATVFTDTSKISVGTINRPLNQWNYGDPASGPLNNSIGVNGSHLYPAPGNYNVTQIVTSALGCKDTIVLPITINSADPVSNFTAANSCSSDSVDLVNLSTVGFGNVTRLEIYWDNVGAPGVFETINAPAFNAVYRHKYPTLQVTRTYNIRMIAYSGVICSNQKITPVTVYATPKVQFNNIPNTCYLVAPFQLTQGSEIGGVPGTGTYSGPGITNPSGTFNPQVAGIGTHNIKYTWTASNAGACIDTLTRTITVLDTAHATFSVTLPSCEQTPTLFTNLSTAPASVTLASTVWNFGDATGPQTYAIAAPVSHTYANPGTYTVTMHNVSAAGCLSTDTSAVITIDANHHITLNGGSNNNQTVCVNTSIAPISYTLSGGATNVTIPALPAGLTYTVAGTPPVLTITGAPATAAGSPYNFSVQTTGNTCQVATTSITITVDPDHVISRNSGDSVQSVCVNTAIDPIVYNLGGGATGAVVANLPPGVTYNITGTLLTISGTPTSTVGSPYNFSIQTTGNSCVKANTLGEIKVNPYPVPAFTFDKTSYCIPNATVGFINNTTPAPTTLYTYNWDFGDGGTASGINASHLYTSAGPFTVTLKARSTVLLNGGVIGCESSKSNLLDIIHPQPKADFVLSKPAGVCIGDNVLITDATDNKDGLPDKYFWNLGDGTTENTYTFTHTYPDTATYVITMYTVNSFGCNSDTINKLPLVGAPYKPFTVYPYPHVNAGLDKNVLEGGSVQLTATAYGIQPQYAWTPADYLTDSKILQPRVTNPKTDMTYRLTVTGKGGCQLSDDVFVKLLKFPVIANTFSPNGDGINDQWRIDFLNTYPDNRVQIFTRAGKLVFESKGYNTPWDGTLKGKPLPFDTYYYIIEPGNGRDPITGYVTILK